jgi:heat-inducible transcriptional repressor
MALQQLTERERQVLELIMEHYIEAAEPVGSRTISKTIGGRLSSATIRNVMADLEEQGFLYKPHSVAGRVPTFRAFRYYLNSLIVLRSPNKKEIERLEAIARPENFHVEEVTGDASRVLASITRFASIVVEPRVDTMLFKEIEFVKLSLSTILIVFVTSSGIVHTRVVKADRDLDRSFLDSMEAYMNERFGGTPFYALKDAIMKDMRRDREDANRLLLKIRDSLETIVEGEDQREIHIEGTSKMIGGPEFSDAQKLKELFRALEKKERLLRLLESCQDREGFNVIIGGESDLKELRDFSIITSAYRLGERSYGILGIIGPLRMNYSKLIPIVRYTARTVTDILRIM